MCATDASTGRSSDAVCEISIHSSQEARSTHGKIRTIRQDPAIKAGIKPLPGLYFSNPIFVDDLLAELVDQEASGVLAGLDNIGYLRSATVHDEVLNWVNWIFTSEGGESLHGLILRGRPR